MPSKLKTPGGDRTWIAGWLIVVGLFYICADLFRGRVQVIGTGLTVLFCICGVGLWFKQQWARWITLLLMAGLAVRSGNSLIQHGLALKQVFFLAGALYGAWLIWKHFSPGMIAEDEEKNRPMISLVLLLSEPRYLEAKVLANIVSSAWGGNYTSDDDVEDKDGFVVGESPMLAVHSSDGFFMVNNIDRPYLDDMEAALKDINELRLRKALSDHRAWLSVDLISLADEDAPREQAYEKIAKLIAELSGPDCLAILQPATGKINVWDTELEEKLRGPNALAEFAVPANVPVVSVADDDPRMMAAAAEARSRWPEFVEAFKKRDGENFSVKAPITVDGNTEFIWVEVIGLEPEYIHGTLGNDPVDLGNLKIGDRVEVPVKDLNDWGFLRAGKPFGLFTLKVLSESSEG